MTSGEIEKSRSRCVMIPIVLCGDCSSTDYLEPIELYLPMALWLGRIQQYRCSWGVDGNAMQKGQDLCAGRVHYDRSDCTRSNPRTTNHYAKS